LNNGATDTVALPSKNQILKGISGIENQIKNKKRLTDKIKAELKKAIKKEKKSRREKRKEENCIEMETQETVLLTVKSKEIDGQQFEGKKMVVSDPQDCRKKKKALNGEHHMYNRDLVDKYAKKVEKCAEKEGQTGYEEECENKNKNEHIEKNPRKLESMLCKARYDAEIAAQAAVKACREAEGKHAALVAETKVIEQTDSYLRGDEYENLDSRYLHSEDSENIENYALMTNNGSGCPVMKLDRPGQMRHLANNILEYNQLCAQRAHSDSLAVIPYTLLNNEGSFHLPPQVSDDESINPSTPSIRKNAEWSNLAREVIGPENALYTHPSRNPYYEYHSKRHIRLGSYVMKRMQEKKRQLWKRWEELGHEYLVRQKDFSKQTPSKLFQARKTLSARAKGSIMNNVVQSSEVQTMNEDIPKRPRRGNAAATTTVSTGNGDFARSDYEQDKIIKELNAKEALEKRIAKGFCVIPRQRCKLEQKLFVSFRDMQTTRRVSDFSQDERERRVINPWTDIEKCIFLDRFLQDPKDFRKIALSLRNKSTNDCVAFYYDSKKSVPYKEALREYHLRKKRRGDVGWDFTIQAALSVGAMVTRGISPEKPLIFTLPDGDNTYYTRHFHPMKRELFHVLIEDDGVDCISSRTEETEKPPVKGQLFLFDDVQVNTKKDSLLESPKRKSNMDNDNTSDIVKVGKESADETINGKILNSDTSRISSSSLAIVRKTPQKWSQEEKKLFFDTVKKHGKNWSMLATAIDSKTMSQIKNYYYDHKKQFGKQQRQQYDNKKREEINIKKSESYTSIENHHLDLKIDLEKPQMSSNFGMFKEAAESESTPSEKVKYVLSTSTLGEENNRSRAPEKMKKPLMKINIAERREERKANFIKENSVGISGSEVENNERNNMNDKSANDQEPLALAHCRLTAMSNFTPILSDASASLSETSKAKRPRDQWRKESGKKHDENLGPVGTLGVECALTSHAM